MTDTKYVEKPFTGTTSAFVLPVEIDCDNGRIVGVALTDIVRMNYRISVGINGSLSLVSLAKY